MRTRAGGDGAEPTWVLWAVLALMALAVWSLFW